jgi:hypothetical protein
MYPIPLKKEFEAETELLCLTVMWWEFMWNTAFVI